MARSKAGIVKRAALLTFVLFTPLCSSLSLGAQRSQGSPGLQRSDGSRGPFRTLQREIDALLGAPEIDRGTWGVVVRSAASRELLYSMNGGKLFVPASNMKILTLAAAADRLGWDYTFETRLVGAGAIDAGGLEGDLVVVGSGDPTIDDWDGAATRLFQSWAETLKRLGIHAIHGRIVGDDNSFDDDPWGSGWAWDDLDRSFATGVGSLQFNQNTAQLRFEPAARAGDPAIVTIGPAGSGLELRNLTTTTTAHTSTALEVRRRLDSPILELRGSLPVASGTIVRNVAVNNPTVYFVTELRDALTAAGIEVRGPAVDIDDITDPPSRARGNVLLNHRSPPLSELASTMMRLSQNLYAETLLKTMGAQRAIGSSLSGRAAVTGVLEGWGLAASDFRVVDGSGLSVYDLVTPDVLVSVLTHVAQNDSLRGPFEAALPIAGREGTLAQRMRGTAAEGNVRAKTGSLSNARAMSGYVRSAEGELLVFSMLVNNFGASSEATDRAMDAIMVRLAQFSRR